MKDVKFNINNTVKVKLTQMGRDIFFNHIEEINKYYGEKIVEPYYPKSDENGYSQFQLHELMSLYGKHLSMGGTVERNTLPFETEILICEA